MGLKDFVLKKHERELQRHFELKKMKEEENAFDAAVKRKMMGDKYYDKDGDKDLTPEQIREIDAFWKKYEFAFKPPYSTFKAFYNRTGICDPRYLPFGTRTYFLVGPMKTGDHRLAFQNKAYLPKTYSGIKQPPMVCRKVEGVYYNAAFEKITEDEAVALCMRTLERIEIVIKPSGKNGGRGVVFLREATPELIKDEFKKIPKLMVVQEALKQHPDMAKLNPSTVNTIRLTTYFREKTKEVVPLAALVKIGNAGVRVDNYKHGGHILGIDVKSGKTQHYAMNVNYDRITELPTGVDLSNGIEIPGFDNVIETATKAHLMTPQMKLISWDIGIDESAEAVIIEANFAGDFRMHHATTGPVFGELTEEMLETYVVKKFFRERGNKEYNFNEFFDHIEITKYAGFDTNVKVPAKINGKPVRVIDTRAFAQNKNIVSVTLPKTIRSIKKKAFYGCSQLESVTGAEKLKKVGEDAFVKCPKMNAEQVKAFNKLK